MFRMSSTWSMLLMVSTKKWDFFEVHLLGDLLSRCCTFKHQSVCLEKIVVLQQKINFHEHHICIFNLCEDHESFGIWILVALVDWCTLAIIFYHAHIIGGFVIFDNPSDNWMFVVVYVLIIIGNNCYLENLLDSLGIFHSISGCFWLYWGKFCHYIIFVWNLEQIFVDVVHIGFLLPLIFP